MRLVVIAAAMCLALSARADDPNVSSPPGPTGGRVKAASAMADTAGDTSTEGDTLAIDGAERSYEGDCGGRDVRISGSGNEVKLTGECGRVAVKGYGNTVEVDTVAEISVRGMSNAVTWARAAGGEKQPRVSTEGMKNEVTQGR